MADVIDISKLTDKDIAALATRCLDALNLHDRIQAVLASFEDDSDKAELAEWVKEGEDPENED